MLSRRYVTLLLVFSLASILVVSAEIDTNGEFKLTVLHTNDMHSRIQETSRTTGACNSPEPCYGGFARLAHKVKELKSSIKNTLFLNAGDTYQGTPMYTLFKWHILVPLMNMLGIDVMSLGNHEFDDGVTGLTPYLQQIRIPVVTCNLDASLEPSLVNRTALKPWHMVVVENVKIAIIGYLTPETKFLSSTGNVVFLDEIEMITKYAAEAKEGGANLVFAVGHSGFFKDEEIARKVADIDLVVGGHTDSFLYTGTPPDIEKPITEYPLVVTQTSGKNVPVVQAYGYTKYLGKLDLVWNNHFQLVSATGNPILLNSSVPKDVTMDETIKAWEVHLDKELKVKQGESKVFLDGKCRLRECNLGNIVTDAFIDYVVVRSDGKNGWTDGPIALVNSGVIRSSLTISENITFGDLLTVLPFRNQLVRLRMQGSTLIKALERSVERYDTTRSVGHGEFLQVSGLKVEYKQNDEGKLVVTRALTRCGNCPVPKYEELDINNNYSVLTSVFVSEGGDGYTMFKSEAIKEYIYPESDVNMLSQYLRKIRPIYPGEEGRIIIPEKLH